MKIEGIVTLVFRNANTGEITKTVTQKNNITTWWMERRVVPNNYANGENNGKFGPNIFISGYDIPATNKDIHIIPYAYAIGNVEAGVTSPRLSLATDSTPAYGEFQQRFAPPAASRDINIIGLTYATSVTSGNPDSILAQAYVSLATTCTQGVLDTLDIFYRVQFPYDYYLEPLTVDITSTGTSAAMTNVLADRFILSPYSADYVNGDPIINYNGNVDFTRLAAVPSRSPTQDSDSRNIGTMSQSGDFDLTKTSMYSSFTIDKNLGAVAGFISFGGGADANNNPWARGLTSSNTEVVQNLFGHSSDAAFPFYDATKLNLGGGTISLDGGSWANPDFPHMYRINITDSGVVGTSKYNFQLRRHFGFVNNTYKNSVRAVSTLLQANSHKTDEFIFANGKTGTDHIDFDRPAFVKYKAGNLGDLICVRKDSVYFLRLHDEDGLLINATNYPTFTPTSITQVSEDAVGNVYVGCRESGVYKITDPFGTPSITVINNTTPGLDIGGILSKCYGVAYGNARVWAMFDGGLFSSIDDGANWVQATFTNVDIVANWSLVKYIHADFTHADHRLFIAFDSSPIDVNYMNLQTLWWDVNTPLGIVGLVVGKFIRNPVTSVTFATRFIVDEPWTYFTQVAPSPTQNKWGGAIPNNLSSSFSITYPTYLTYGTASRIYNAITALSSYAAVVGWELDAGGDQVISTISAPPIFINNYVTYKDNNTYVVSDFFPVNDTAQGSVTDIKTGLVCMLGKMVCLFAFSDTTLQEYALATAAQHNDPLGAPHAHLLWDSYGWTGSAWVLNDPGVKNTHVAQEVLTDGLTIGFTNGTGSPVFIADEYYTVGVLNGIWLDGATRFDHKTGVYFNKILDGQTALGAGTLSGTPNVPEVFRRSPPVGGLTWQDINNVTVTDNRLSFVSTSATYGTSGARSIQTIGPGSVNKSARDTVYGRFTWGTYLYTNNANSGQVAGLSPSSVVGTPININTISYGIEVVSTGDSYWHTINIVEGGVVVASNLRSVWMANYIYDNYDFEVEILNDGTVNYYVWSYQNDATDTCVGGIRDLIYTSATTAVTTIEYVVDVVVKGNTSNGLNLDFTRDAGTNIQGYPVEHYPTAGNRMVSRVPEDLYVSIGTFAGSNGRYTPNFVAVDNTQNFNVLIDGTAPTLILADDVDTVLGAGEISVFRRAGYIRYSGADASKSISASYQIIVTE